MFSESWIVRSVLMIQERALWTKLIGNELEFRFRCRKLTLGRVNY
jgi:hypothetical protein